MTTAARPDISKSADDRLHDAITSIGAHVPELNNFVAEVARELAMTEWTEDEIIRAQQRHPEAADTLFHSFSLLSATTKRMHVEFVYRSHCRELLERVVARADTRPGTAVEVICALSEVTKVTPIRSSAVGLYLRLWDEAFPDKPLLPESRPHYEALKGETIDDNEVLCRAKLTVNSRALGTIKCCGKHHAEPVSCSYHVRASLL